MLFRSEVYLSAPILEQIEYRFARKCDFIPDPEITSEKVVFSISCVTNFFWPELCGKYIKHMNGPAAYGEIAYQLINQTTVYVTIDDVNTGVK